ncbi:MAG: hypothetical protein K2Q97_16615 [Burkholderiaceae bacterium]|nr:hypothetical protein [Burkholderiaceae bacterium]
MDDKTDAAYRRSDALEKRRVLMQEWSNLFAVGRPARTPTMENTETRRFKKIRKKTDPLPQTQVIHLTAKGTTVFAFAMGKTGAERAVLERIAEATVRGEAIHPDLQKISNLILAKALLSEKLPDRAAGRPRDTTDHLKHVERAYRYYEELDKSTPEAAERVGAETPVGTRQIEREAQKYRDFIGGRDPEARARFRAWRAEVSDEDYRETMLQEFQRRAGPTTVKTAAPKEALIAIVNDLVAAIQLETLQSINSQTVDPPVDTTGEIDDADDPFS